MEKAKLLCQRTSGKFLGVSRVFIHDTKGEEISGVVSLAEEPLHVDILEHHGDKAFVLLPMGLSKKTAWINSENFY